VGAPLGRAEPAGADGRQWRATVWEVAMSEQQREHERLRIAVRTADDVAALDPEELGHLAHWVSSELLRVEPTPTRRWVRTLTVWAATLATVFLVPWVAWLAWTLPSRIRTHEWNITWVGFDVAMIAVFALTAWMGWKRRQLVLPLMLTLAILLLCDAWFDLTLSYGSGEEFASVLTAAFAEVPAAIVLILLYRRALRVFVTQVRHERGDFRPTPPLWRQQLLLMGDAPPDEPRPG
jgi:hypothetical protein